MSKSVAKRFLHIFGSRVGTFLLTILVTPFLVRALGSDLYGDYAFLLSILSLVMILVNAGIFDGTRKFVSEERSDSKWKLHVIGFYGQVAFVLAGIASILMLLAVYTGVIETVWGSLFELYFILLVGLILLRQTLSFLRGCLMGFGDERYSEPLQIGRKGLFGLTAILLAFAGHGVSGVLIGHLVATGIACIMSIWFFRRHVTNWSSVIRIPRDFPRRELLGFNGLSVILIFLTASLYNVDIILLRSLTGSVQTGYYKASLIVAEFLWFAPKAAQTVLLHSTSELWSKNEISSVEEIATRTTRYTLALTLLMAIGIGALANSFVPLYFGEGFTATVTPLLLLLPGSLSFAVARPIFAIGQGKGELRPLIFATGVASLLNLVLNLLLIPQYGLHGAAVATSAGYGSMLVLHVLAAQRIGFNPISDLRGARIIVTGILSTPAIVGLAIFLPPVSALLIVPPVGFSIYVFLSTKLGVIDSKELNEVKQRIPWKPSVPIDIL